MHTVLSLKCLRHTIQNRRRGKFSPAIVLLHDNARLHSAWKTSLAEWEIPLEHLWASSVSSGPGAVGLFPISKIKEHFAGKRFANAEDVKNAVVIWLNNQADTWYTEGIHKLVARYDKCLNVKDDYVER